MITAKVVLGRKDAHNKSDENSPVALHFQPDYAQGRNAEWADATPSLSLSMTVRADVATKFTEGTAYTLQFVPEVG